MLIEILVSIHRCCAQRFSILVPMIVGLSAVCAISGADEKPPSAVDKSASQNDEQVTELKYACRVVDIETGNGISGAEVLVRRLINVSGEIRVFAETTYTTDVDGQYEIVIPPDQVAQKSLMIELDVRHEQYASKNGTFSGLGLIRRNEKLGQRPFFERTELYPGEEVRGTIVSPEGSPLAGVDVFGFSAAPSGGILSSARTTTVSGADGSFRLVFHKKGEAAIWIVPNEFAVIEKFLANRRGDIGQIRLSPGVRLTGQVLDIVGTPVSGVFVNLSFSGKRELGQLPKISSTHRSALTDNQGRFMLNPVPAGEFQVSVDETEESPFTGRWGSRSRPLAAVFLPKRVTLTTEKDTANENMHAVPHLIFHAQNLDHHEKKTKGFELGLHGRIDGHIWSARGVPDEDGAVTLKVPHGLQEAEVGIAMNSRSAARYRQGKGQPLRDGCRWIPLGTLIDDIDDFETVIYMAPVALVGAVNEERQKIPKFTIQAKYVTPQLGDYITSASGSDIWLDQQDDGRYRSERLLPDEDVTFTISADGYSSVEEKINLKEGETKEVSVILKKLTNSE